ncbi:senescence associated gene 20-like [Vicia villosa]|uniref:senescence associated gene 20-like n=1 Tax=Vicia villosa TaxID=3911 RepID=UPI00273B953D|nr:senescence associated gene 20-like [Vicia villosa]XP_058766945.1 senescence associated gene 20-like [Vicia villosa]
MDSMIEKQNKSIVEILYKALLGQGAMEFQMVAKLLASDLEYWFHGPPKCQHMMRVLTGEIDHKKGFKFEPRSVTSIGDCVIVEGWEGQAYWVHVWTLKNGLITQFREYFNTWLVVRDLRPLRWEEDDHHHHKHDSMMTLWRSQPRDLYRRSLPGLVLAI